MITSLVVELTPGPNMGYLAVLSAREGRRAGLATTLGIALGLFLVGAAAALGLSAIISTSRFLYEALRWAGTLYLLWLAWEAWQVEGNVLPGETNSPREHSRHFVRGLLTNLLNPKAGLFYIAVLPTFLDNDQPTLRQVIVLTAVYVAIATVVHASIVLLADAARPWLETGSRRRITRRVSSILLAIIAVWLFVSTKYQAS